MKQATLCFVICGEKLLMINRNKPPFMGMWNAVGGKVEKGESTKDCAIREIKEESGITVENVELLSTFTWNYDDEVGYAYLSMLPKDFDVSRFPLETKEGIIAFKDLSWVVNEKNYGVIQDLRVFVKDILNGEKHDYHLVYNESKLVDVIVK